MKLFLTCIVFLSLTISTAMAQENSHTTDSHDSNFINEMELGLDSGDGVVELAHFKTTKNTDSTLLLLPGSIYLAGHTGHFETMGYDRFSTFLLNVLNHHANNIRGVELESGVKLLGFEQQPFGAEPGSTLKFLRLNFTEVDITSVVDLDKEGNKKIHFVLAAKLGVSKQNESLSALSSEEQYMAQELFGCIECQTSANNTNWGLHNSLGVAVEFEFKRLLVKTYAEINRDFSSVMLSGNPNHNLNYNMTEKKLGIEVEYNILDLGNAGHINMFTSLEYYNLNQNMNYPNNSVPVSNRINTDGILYKFGLKYNLGTFKRKKNKGHH